MICPWVIQYLLSVGTGWEHKRAFLLHLDTCLQGFFSLPVNVMIFITIKIGNILKYFVLLELLGVPEALYLSGLILKSEVVFLTF